MVLFIFGFLFPEVPPSGADDETASGVAVGTPSSTAMACVPVRGDAAATSCDGVDRDEAEEVDCSRGSESDVTLSVWGASGRREAGGGGSNGSTTDERWKGDDKETTRLKLLR